MAILIGQFREDRGRIVLPGAAKAMPKFVSAEVAVEVRSTGRARRRS